VAFAVEIFAWWLALLRGHLLLVLLDPGELGNGEEFGDGKTGDAKPDAAK